VSVSGAILLGIGLPSFLGVSPLGVGANTPTHTPKLFGFDYINMNVIGQRKKKRALFIRPFLTVSDDAGFDLGGGGGSRTSRNVVTPSGLGPLTASRWHDLRLRPFYLIFVFSEGY
jgi:hypothetical protein